MKQSMGQEDPRIRPCHHMETQVSGMCDDTLSGPARWYTRFHLLTCSRCRKALKALRALRERLGRLGDTGGAGRISTLAADHRSALERGMEEVERRNP
ncbi:MAG TPA: hypothetical protein VKU00_07090 [Chthonomonadaceae bacterium]|nr:hypothetical protein [Chthonomonadaceae bacterium]